MNRCVFSGRVATEPEVREFTNSKGETSKGVNYTLAVTRYWQLKKNAEDADSADFIHCVGYGNNAAFIEKYVAKGMKLIVEGKLRTGSYVDKDGIKRYTSEIIVDRQEFAEGKEANEKYRKAPAQATTAEDVPPFLDDNDDFTDNFA